MSPILSTELVPTGSLPRGPRRFIAGAVIALAGILPGASVAAEPDNTQEGTVAPGQGIAPEADPPAFDPGGDTALPFDAGPPPSGPPSGDPDDGGPVEAEPLSDPDVPSAPTNEPPGAPPGSVNDPAVEPIGEAPQAAPPTGGFEIEPAAPGDTAETPAPSPAVESLGPERGSETSHKPERLTWVTGPQNEPPSAEALSTDYEIAPAPEPAEPDAALQQDISVEATAAPTEDENRPRTEGAARFHTVERGESLWIIAERLLGPGAGAAEIASEVARLWELNARTIGTGDPSMIMSGTKIRLR